MISERSLEETIERTLLASGPDAYPVDISPLIDSEPPEAFDFIPGGYHKRASDEYDTAHCLIPRDVIDFIVATQPATWNRLSEHYGSDVQRQFLTRLSAEIARRGALDVLRNGVKDAGCKFQLAYFPPASALNEETRQLYQANIFSVVRQLYFSNRDGKSLDVALFLNGVPVFTAELKNPLNGQTVEDAIRQYRTQRDPREPLFGYGRCLAHFAVDPDLVYSTTHLRGPATAFLPFNKGRYGGAGNPPVPPTRSGYATAYLWETTWARDSVLDLIRQFIHEVEDEDERGRKNGRRFLLFPRYHQLESVRKLIADARLHGAGKRYLIQHSAGSGKSFTIGWLAHRLTTLHDAANKRVFDSIIVITDRRVLDRQLQQTMRQFEQVLGVVENIDTTSRHLKEALEAGKAIVVTTLQKFPFVAQEISELPGKRFAVIVDEAHSSQSGEQTKSLKDVLSARSLEEAEAEESETETPEAALETRIAGEMQKRGPLPNLSFFAFTATPKRKTLELFGIRRDDGKYEPFHLYTMRQAIEEGFILDVLANYATYKAYWRLLKTIQDDPRYDKRKAEHLLQSFVELHPHAIGEKMRIMTEHFAAQVQSEIGGRAKAMIVTRSRLHAVRYRLAIDRYLAEQDLPFKALVAFSGTVQDGGASYTESGMNGFPDSQTAKMFERPEHRFLIVADKFQTGFDQPLLHTMYVDKRLAGVNAVQTLSRLNRTHPEKKGTMVLDFANDAEQIRAAFEPYYETTLLSEGTDPNLLYEVQNRLLAFSVYAASDIERFTAVYYDPAGTQDRIYAAFAPVLERFRELMEEERHDFRKQLGDYTRLYAFLAQILTFADADLEKLYQFARYLRRLLPVGREVLPVDVQQSIDVESYQLRETHRGRVGIERKAGILDPQSSKGANLLSRKELEPLSRIVADLNERFGLNLGPEHRATLGQMLGKLHEDSALDAAARVNTRDNVRLTFDHKVDGVIQQIVDSNFDLYKRITDDPGFGEALKELLFDQYLPSHRNAEELIKRGESKTLEFKSTLRYGIKEDRRDDPRVTQAVLKTIAAFLNTDGGDLLIGVGDDRSIVGIETDGFESDDKFMLHLSQVTRNGLGDWAATRIDPRIQVIEGKSICVVNCQRSPEPVVLKWKGLEKSASGDFYVRNGPGTVALGAESASKYIQTRFPLSRSDA